MDIFIGIMSWMWEKKVRAIIFALLFAIPIGSIFAVDKLAFNLSGYFALFCSLIPRQLYEFKKELRPILFKKDSYSDCPIFWNIIGIVMIIAIVCLFGLGITFGIVLLCVVIKSINVPIISGVISIYLKSPAIPWMLLFGAIGGGVYFLLPLSKNKIK